MGAFTRKPQFTTGPQRPEILFNVCFRDAMDPTNDLRYQTHGGSYNNNAARITNVSTGLRLKPCFNLVVLLNLRQAFSQKGTAIY